MHAPPKVEITALEDSGGNDDPSEVLLASAIGEEVCLFTVRECQFGDG